MTSTRTSTIKIMAERAQVTSVEAVESFRASLVVFLKRARVALEEACDEILRARAWVQDDRRPHWQKEMQIRGSLWPQWGHPRHSNK